MRIPARKSGNHSCNKTYSSVSKSVNNRHLICSENDEIGGNTSSRVSQNTSQQIASIKHRVSVEPECFKRKKDKIEKLTSEEFATYIKQKGRVVSDEMSQATPIYMRNCSKYPNK